MSTEREHFSSRLGFILAAAGSAVGIGNLVGFPVNAAKNGGGAFLLMYALFVFFICLPVMVAEMAVGRKTAKEPVGAYKTLSGGSQSLGRCRFSWRANAVYDCCFLYGINGMDFWLYRFNLKR